MHVTVWAKSTVDGGSLSLLHSMATICCRLKQEVLDLACRDLTEIMPITNIMEEEKHNLGRVGVKCAQTVILQLMFGRFGLHSFIHRESQSGTKYYSSN